MLCMHELAAIDMAEVCGCSDVICEYPLREMLAFHKKNGAEGTILVTQVLSPCLANASLGHIIRQPSSSAYKSVFEGGLCAAP